MMLVIPLVLMFGLVSIFAISYMDNHPVISLTALICAIMVVAVVWFGVSPSLDTLELKTVTVCDKFIRDHEAYVALSDGVTYQTKMEVYGYIPRSGEITVEFRTSSMTENVIIDKIYGNTTCMTGCG